MKNLIIIVSILLSPLALTQNIKWGVKGGLNINNLSNANTVILGESKVKLGIHFGGFMEYKINDKFYLQPELLYSTQGARFNKSHIEEGEFASIKKNTNLTYLTLPIILKYKLSDKFNIEFGPQLGIALEVKEKVEANIDGKHLVQEINGFEDKYIEVNNKTIHIPSNAKRFNLGLNIGASYDITEAFFVQARYNFDLTKIVDYPSSLQKVSQTPVIIVADQTDMKNSVFQLSVGYKF